MSKLILHRLLALFLWLSLSIGSLRGWKYLAALKPEDQQIWNIYDCVGGYSCGISGVSVLVENAKYQPGK